MEYIGLADNVKHNIFEFPTPTDMIFSNKGQDEVFFKLSSPKQRSPPETVRFQTRNMKTTPAEDLPRGFDHNKTQMIATVKQEEDESTPGCGFATAQNNTGCQWFFACDVNGYTGGSVRMNCNDYVTADKSRSNRECFSFTNDHRRGLTKSELRQSRSTPKFAVDDSESKVSGSSARRSALNQEKYIKEENMVEFDSNELLCEKQAPPFNTDRSFWQGSLNNKGSETCQKRIPGIEFNPAKQPRSGVTLSSDQLPYRELPQTDWTYFQRELNTGSLANENNKASIFNNMDFSEFMDDISGALGATNIGIEDSDLEIDAEWRNLENQSIPNDMPTDIGCDKMNSRKEQPGFDLGNNEINLLLEAIQTRSFLPIAYLLCSALNTKGHPTDLSDLTSFKLDTISKLLATNICTHVDDEIPSISISSDKFAPTLSSQSSCDSEHSSVWSYCQPSLSDGFDTNEVIMNSDTNESEISYDAYRNHSTGSKRPSLHDISEFTVPKSRRREESENSTESKENSPHELVNFFDEMIKCNSRCDLQTFQDLLESKDETIEAKLSNTRFLKQASTTAKERETGTYEKGVAQNSPILLMDQNNNAQSTTDCGKQKYFPFDAVSFCETYVLGNLTLAYYVHVYFVFRNLLSIARRLIHLFYRTSGHFCESRNFTFVLLRTA